jgi:hypothetical protein
MWKSLRRILWYAPLSAALAAAAFLPPTSVARADDNQDYNAYWRDQAEPLPQEQAEMQQKQNDYNAYWQEAAEIQQRADQEQPQQQQADPP